MTPLMRKRTFLIKWVLPYVSITLVVLWQAYKESAKAEPNYGGLGFIWLALLVILYVFIKRQTNHEPDEVLDGGTFLRVVRGSLQEDIPFADLQAVDTTKLVRLTRLYLHFRKPTLQGPTISFYPLQDKNASGENAVAVALRGKLAQ